MNMSAKYNHKNDTILLANTNQLYLFINELGGDIDMVAWKPLLSLVSYRTNGDVIERPSSRKTKETLRMFNEWYKLDLNVEACQRLAGSYLLKFNSTPKLLVEPSVPEVTPIEDVIEQTPDEELIEFAEHLEALDAEEEEVDEVLESLKVELNWKKMSSPTFGKKNLIAAALEVGIELDSTMKYPKMVEDFKAQFEEV